MGLIKEKALENGAVVSYWRVDMISLDKGRGQITFALLGYCSKEIAVNNSQMFLDCASVGDFFEGENRELFNYYFRDCGANFKDIDTACYEYAKEHVEFFKDAVDDEEENEYQIELLKKKQK